MKYIVEEKADKKPAAKKKAR